LFLPLLSLRFSLNLFALLFNLFISALGLLIELIKFGGGFVFFISFEWFLAFFSGTAVLLIFGDSILFLFLVIEALLVFGILLMSIMI